MKNSQELKFGEISLRLRSKVLWTDDIDGLFEHYLDEIEDDDYESYEKKFEQCDEECCEADYDLEAAQKEFYKGIEDGYYLHSNDSSEEFKILCFDIVNETKNTVLGTIKAALIQNSADLDQLYEDLEHHDEDDYATSVLALLFTNKFENMKEANNESGQTLVINEIILEKKYEPFKKIVLRQIASYLKVAFGFKIDFVLANSRIMMEAGKKNQIEDAFERLESYGYERILMEELDGTETEEEANEICNFSPFLFLDTKDLNIRFISYFEV